MSSAAEATGGKGRPPTLDERDFVGDLDVRWMLVAAERAMVWAPLTESIRTVAGTAPVGVVATLFDVVSSMPTLIAVEPDWTATQNLSVHAAGWLTEGPIVVDASLVRVGKKAVVVEASIYDGHGTTDLAALRAAIDASAGPEPEPRTRPETVDAGERTGGGGAGSTGPRRPTLVGRGLLTFTRLPTAAAIDGGARRPPTVVGELHWRPLDPPDERPLAERMGLEVVDGPAGVLELARTPYVTNSIGTINGGALCVMLDTAAGQMCPGLVPTDLAVHFLSQMRVGPARTRGTISRASGDHAVVTVEVVDHGADDHVMAMATMTLQRPPA